MELANAKSIGRSKREGTRCGTGKKSAECQQFFMSEKAQMVTARSVAQPSLRVISRKNATSGSPLISSESTCTVFSGRVGWVVLIGLGAAASMQSGESRQVKRSLVAVEQCRSIAACGGWNYKVPSFLARWKSVRPGILSSICTRQGLRISRGWYVAWEVGSQQHLIPCDMTMEYPRTWVDSSPSRDRNDGKRKDRLIAADGSPHIQLVFPDKPKIKPHAIWIRHRRAV
jgi:hypothetical protein